jgi:hypothetical protein
MAQPTAKPDVSVPSATPTAPISGGLPPIPPEVRQFAEEVGAAPYLLGVLAMTLRAFPPERVAVILLEDAEIEDYRHVAFDIDVTGWTAEQMLQTHNQWTAAIIDHCPPTHAPYFTLANWASR